jgi:hypothetical protein
VCEPKTCLDLGVVCGSIDDGCGLSIVCGTCPAGLECTGVPPVCTPPGQL